MKQSTLPFCRLKREKGERPLFKHLTQVGLTHGENYFANNGKAQGLCRFAGRINHANIQMTHVPIIDVPEKWLKQSDQMHLALHIHGEGLQLALFDYQNRQPVHLFRLRIQPWEIPALISQQGLNQHLFRKVSITYDSDSWTLVPELFFEESKIELWMSDLPAHQMHHTMLTDERVILVDRHHQSMESIALLFPQASVKSWVHPWLQLTSPQHEKGEILFANLEAQKINIHLIKGGKRLLANPFESRSWEDSLYFISAALQNFECSEKTMVVVTGEDVSEELMESLKPYIGGLNLWLPPMGLHLPKNEWLPAQWHSVLMHTLCA